METTCSNLPVLACTGTFIVVCTAWFTVWALWPRIDGKPHLIVHWAGLAPLGILVSVIAGFLVWAAIFLYNRWKYGVPSFERLRSPPATTSTHRQGGGSSGGAAARAEGSEAQSEDSWITYIRALGGRGNNGQNSRSIELQDFPEATPRVVQGTTDFTPPLAPSFRTNPANYLTMGLKKMEMSRWLTIDSGYHAYWTAKDILLRERNTEVIICQDEQVAEDACVELLAAVVDFMVEHYPQCFVIYSKKGTKPRSQGQYVLNKLTKEEFKLRAPYTVHPLEAVARLAMEDFNVLVKDDARGQHYLLASATVFPAGWRLKDRAGFSVTDLHGPVPQWKDKLSKPVEHYFSRLNYTSSMERSTFFIQTVPKGQSLSKTLFVQYPKEFFPLNAEKIMIRHERQTFRRLPASKAIVFTVKTTLTALEELSVDDLAGLRAEVLAWPEDVAEHKARDVWGGDLLAYCEAMYPSSTESK